jgi:hypothetical protein
MPVKKTTGAKKAPQGKKRIGLTSAIGPKATTMVVILVMAGGIIVGARQQQAKAREALEAGRANATLTPEPTVANRKSATAASTSSSNGVSTSASATSSTPAAAAKATPATVTGCLERVDEGFRLKDTSGADAPKSRSWKSGFLKKGSATLDVVDASHTLQLADFVGRRVSVTGAILDREMRARSVRGLGACKAN